VYTVADGFVLDQPLRDVALACSASGISKNNICQKQIISNAVDGNRPNFE
jgi:hypothetical protein